MGFRVSTRRTHGIITLWAVLFQLGGGSVSAAESSAPAQVADPAATPSLVTRQPPETFLCQRKILYQGKYLNCDSQLARDGENLRPIFQDVPQALAELDTYQRNRLRVKPLVYWSTAGILVAGIGYLISKQMTGLEAITVRNTTVMSGLAVSAGTFSYGLIMLRSNERHLENAVALHNQAHPDRPIELQVSAGFSF